MNSLAKINNPYYQPPRILIAPLDWGLGHATRCIPIIKELLNAKCEVWIAATGDQKALLKEEFPDLIFVEIPGYDIKYGKNRAFTLLKIIISIPKILIRIKRENRWLQQFCRLKGPDAVISDNRYGLYAPGVCTVFMTHQLTIRTPFGPKADAILRRLHYRAIRHFSLCWVPDGEGQHSLAGALSHPAVLPSMPTRYIGLLSRMEPPGGAGNGRNDTVGPEIRGAGQGGAGSDESCDLLILLSGPEPQRTLFERLILEQLSSWPGRAILVRGKPAAGGSSEEGGGSHEEQSDTPKPKEQPSREGGKNVRPGLTVYDHLPAKALNAVICGAEIVIARAGYSTIMDLVKLGKRAILVPTPGQSEQEYLGSYLADRKIAVCVAQSRFNLPDALAMARDFPFTGIGEDKKDLLHAAIVSFLEELRGGYSVTPALG